MIRRVPHYYKKFHCISSECKDNCCVGGWEINIDDETAKYYLSLESKFGERLKESIVKKDEYCFKLKDGKCPFLDNKGLCEIYQVLGEDKMGVVCTQFPRYTEYYGSVKETGIGLACEEAARIICMDKEAFSLEETDVEEEEIDDSELDKALAEVLFDVRKQLFLMIDSDEISLKEKLNILLNICHMLQEAVNVNDYSICKQFSAFSVCDLKNRFYKEKNVCNICRKQGMERILYAYDELEVLNDDWSRQKEALFEFLYKDSYLQEKYNSDYICFWNDMKEYKYEYENIIKYFIFRYFMKAAYDHDVFGKAQFIVTSFLVLQEMDFLRWLQNGKSYKFKDRMELIHIFSREIEYSEDNLSELSEEFLFDDIFQRENLCELLKSL